jgi:hypothetical protein
MSGPRSGNAERRSTHGKHLRLAFEQLSKHEEYTPDAFKTSMLELLREYVRSANAVVARIQIMTQIKRGGMRFSDDSPEESDDSSKSE